MLQAYLTEVHGLFHLANIHADRSITLPLSMPPSNSFAAVLIVQQTWGIYLMWTRWMLEEFSRRRLPGIGLGIMDQMQGRAWKRVKRHLRLSLSYELGMEWASGARCLSSPVEWALDQPERGLEEKLEFLHVNWFLTRFRRNYYHMILFQMEKTSNGWPGTLTDSIWFLQPVGNPANPRVASRRSAAIIAAFHCRKTRNISLCKILRDHA